MYSKEDIRDASLPITPSEAETGEGVQNKQRAISKYMDIANPLRCTWDVLGDKAKLKNTYNYLRELA